MGLVGRRVGLMRGIVGEKGWLKGSMKDGLDRVMGGFGERKGGRRVVDR